MSRKTAVVGVALLLACHDPITPSGDPGFVVASVNSPFPQTGAVRLELSGTGIDSVRSTHSLFVASESAGARGVIVLGSAGSGILLRFWVPDRGMLSEYQVEVVEAAAGDTYAQLDPAQYSVALAAESQ